jgi:hypothetical protein
MRFLMVTTLPEWKSLGPGRSDLNFRYELATRLKSIADQICNCQNDVPGVWRLEPEPIDKPADEEEAA